VLLIAVLAGVVGLVPAPADQLVVVRNGRAYSVPVAWEQGYAAAHGSDLAKALGYVWAGSAMDLDGDLVVFASGSPFFRDGDRVYQLPNSTYGNGPDLMVPVSWALNWLPSARSQRWRYLDGRLVERPPATVRRPERDRWVVVLDAGHGGADPGTVGLRGTREKDIVLDIAGEVAKRLEGERDIQVVLTRDRDTLISFADRPGITQVRGMAEPPDLFLSIHANSMPKKPSDTRGVETYFLAVAKTEHARQVAMRENSALEFETDTPEDVLEPLQFILSDLQSAGNLQESRLFASAIDQSLMVSVSAPSLGVKQAGFIVLANATMPAALVEVGFLSNREEEALLRSSSYRAKIADALADAVVLYLAEYGRRVWSSYDSGGQ
jgi:N-acetylmuramoyl-L-alanine amidase